MATEAADINALAKRLRQTFAGTDVTVCRTSLRSFAYVCVTAPDRWDVTVWADGRIDASAAVPDAGFWRALDIIERAAGGRPSDRGVRDRPRTTWEDLPPATGSGEEG